MLRLVAYEPDGRPIFMFGLSKENVRRLQRDMPIQVDLATMVTQGDPVEAKVVIFAGEDEHAMMNQLRGAIGPDTRVHVDPKFGGQ